ncbi:S8 family serine peptidase [Pelagicoccus sp. SDUM812002]|uniref:S8 family serine peptidase n=1 Tax=Pelagicoccus sp. SDUM812002 TaxID=3041266 RepID=UPI00281271EC|nr:S8 family serine peptidase [Pelagicoccus sp. SDUM812002]
MQYLLKRDSGRIRWVVWEEKIQVDENGRYTSVGSIAHMGNVFLIDADPDLVGAEELESFVADNALFRERESVVADYLCLGFKEPELGKIEMLIAAFQKRFPGAIAEFDTLSFPSTTPSDWDPSRMWGLDQIDAEEAWQFETGDPDNEVVVAVIDTGMQLTHPDLVENLFVDPSGSSAVWDFVDSDENPEDEDGHGTHVAGIAGAVGNNGSGAVGVNWGVQILPLKVGERDGLRNSAINDALAYVGLLKESGINIVATNNSYGSGGSNLLTRREIENHERLGILFVAASGNDGKNLDASPESLEFPAGYDLENIISVGSSNQEDALNASSNYGEVSVDISAPGSDIYSTYPTNSYNFLSGTSMASPMVAGAVALLAQANPGMTAEQLKTRILETGDPLSALGRGTLTGKRLNLLAALKPELSGHFLEVANVKDAIVLVESAGPEVTFELAALDGAVLGAEVLSGISVGEVRDLGQGIFRFRTKESGQATIRFSASLSGTTRTVDKTVVVGRSAAVKSGLKHHFAFEGSGSLETDLAGSSNGSIAGATRSQAEYGGSLLLDNANERMTFEAAFSDVVTIAALVRSNDMSVSPHPRIVNLPYYYLYFSSGNGSAFPDGNRQTLKFFSNYESFGVWNTPPRSVQDSEWYFVVGTYDSTNISNTPNLYINGQRQEVLLQQSPIGSIVRSQGSSYVGNNDLGDRAFDGLIADIRIYDRALNHDEVIQLGASLMQSRWDGAYIDLPESAAREERVSLNILGLDYDDSLNVDWYFEGDGQVAVSNSSGTSSVAIFRSEGPHTIWAQVSDGVATRIVERKVNVLDGRLSAGHYLGTSSNGGQAWLEVEDTLESGYVTVFDLETGFYRIRELVTLESAGTFQSGETSAGAIRGVALRKLLLEVPGYGLEFVGELQVAPSSESSYSGSYEGGGVGVPGDSVYLKVLPDGRAFLWREGPFADLAIGSHGLDGRIVITSFTGKSVDVSIDPESGLANGRWGEQQVFLKSDRASSDSRLKAGAAGGYPSSSGANGLFAEFIGIGEAPSLTLSEGRFSEDGRPPSDNGPVVLLGAGGGSLQIERSKSDDGIADAVAAAVFAGTLDLDSKVVRGIRAQSPVTADSSGLLAFSIEGDEPLEVLVRGLGPSFSDSGAEDPKIVIYHLVEGVAVDLEPNDNWRDDALFTSANESGQGAFRRLASGFDALQLSPLSDDAKDAAQRVWLEAGDYLVLIQLANGAGGSGLIEVLAL